MGSRYRSDINVTPLVDIVLVLLIVFMTLVPALPHALPALLPSTGQGGPALPVLRLALMVDGSLLVAGQTGVSLAEALRGRPQRILLRVHPDLPLSAPTRLLDEIEGLHPGTKVALQAWAG
jgi:biopolymer transport protein ExbD